MKKNFLTASVLVILLAGICRADVSIALYNIFTNDVTPEAQPRLTGFASSTTSTISSVEWRVDGGSWQAATGTFGTATVEFSFRPGTGLVRSTTPHVFQARATNAAGETTDPLNKSVYIVDTRPMITFTADNVAVVSGDPIDTTPQFEVKAVTEHPPLTKFKLMINNDSHDLTDTDTTNPAVYVGTYTASLADGSYRIRAIAVDSLGRGATQEATHVLVQSGIAIDIESIPLNYPNPFDPRTQTTSIAYVLSKSANIELRLYDLMGNFLYKANFAADAAGAKAGYNEVTWDGKTGSGTTVGNGIYIYVLLSDGKLLGKGKISVLAK
ncbi:MAG: hypothetical protein ABIJ26_02615 [Candidatus Margulisiibacteriota bacterium]